MTNSPTDALRICNRHKARTLGKLEELNCPEGFLDIVRAGFGYLRSDLVELGTKPKSNSHH
ncbi:hypothetical protein P4C99_20130 [Pontiellaceae bacterium B1224]|nr:hypothetical protein [Pontiellaceae bacterium B1224]